jgi:pimeloyl-ACP methyl ester carboxylesterase
VTAATITQTQTAEVDGLRIRYADSGTAAGGPVIVFTSPWPESLFAFRRVWPALSAAVWRSRPAASRHAHARAYSLSASLNARPAWRYA